VYATPVQGEYFYTVEEAARALKLTPDRIRQMLRDGELEAVPPQGGGTSAWKIPIRVIHGQDRPPAIDFSESSTTGPERPSESDDISSPQEIRREEEPGPTPAQPKRDDPAENTRESAAPSTHLVTAEEATRILERSADALLEAKDEVIEDLRDRVAFLERQLEDRAEEIRRRDHIIAALTERIPPALEAPDHEKPPRARENTAEEEPARVALSDAGGPQGGSERPRDTVKFPMRGLLLRPWWKRVFRR
jgi:excisionase family DNA binding protein